MRLRSLFLAALMTLSVLSGVVANDTVTTQDVDISGNYVMTGNYTVSHGTTLTIKPGTVVDMQDYWMKVEGTLIADNATIMSSIQTTGQGSHNAGVWDALTISQGGTAILDNVTISNAKSCIIVDGTLTATSLTIEDCLIGIEVSGQADISILSIESVDNDGLRISGLATLSDVVLSDITTGLASSGTVALTGGDFTQTGTGVSLTGGSADIEDLNFVSGVGNAVSISSSASGDIDGMTGTSRNAIVAIDANGFSLSNIDMSGERLINSWSAGNLSISHAVYESTSSETPIDVRTSETVTLSHVSLTGQFSSLQGAYDAPWIGMSLAGSGTYKIDNSSIESTDTALVTSGTGTLSVYDTTFTSKTNGLSFSGISATILDSVTVNMSSDAVSGIDILQGHHEFSELEVNMPFNQYETGSTGIEAWWCSIDSDEVTVNGFANSFELYESIAEFDDLNLLDSSEQGLYASSSMVHVSDSLVTKVSDAGLYMVSSSAVLRTWDASYHEDGSVIDADSKVTVWSMTSTSNLDSDSTGDGILNYGTTQTLNVDTANSNRLWEMTVSFEDLTGNPVDADWQTLGFSGTANSGSAVLPVSETGSQITATFAGVGAISTPTGTQGGTHTIQVPIMPQGDWVLPSGSVVVLGPTEDGTPHSAGGNITIPANANLILQDTALMIPENATLMVDSYGNFEGENSEFHGDVVSHSADFANSPSSNLSVHGDVFWTSCQNDIDVYNLNINGEVELDNSCKVTINSGSVPTNTTVGVGAVFEIVNTLDVTVLDKGEPVSGATITVGGQSVSTDANGMATKSTTSLMVDSSGTTTSGLVQVQMSVGQITDLMGWDTSMSMEHTFIASTISGGTLDSWLELEKAWSPYHLTSDLVIPAGETMTVNDGVFLRVADQVTITVEGTFNAGYSTISSMGDGARWGGLVIGGGAETTAMLIGTSMVEGAPLISIEGQSETILSHAYLARSSSAEPLLRSTGSAFMAHMSIISTTFTDSASHCIELHGSIEFYAEDLETNNCESDALWALGTYLSIDGMTTQDPVTMSGVEGELHDLDGTEVTVDNVDGFSMSDLTLESIYGADNREINIDGAVITGAPAIDFDNTAGVFSNLAVDCGGSGTGITSHHGRASSSIQVSDSTVSSCTKGVDLHTDGESSPLILTDVVIDSMVAISSDGSDVLVQNGILNGSVDINNAIANLYDVTPLSQSTSLGEIIIWSTHIFDVRLGGNAQTANLVFEVGDYWTGSAEGSSIQVSLPTKVVDDTGTVDFNTVRVIASAPDLPDTDKFWTFGVGEEEIIQIDMIGNSAPEVEIIIPDDGFRIMETLPIEIRAVISDDLDSNSDLQIVWKVTVGQEEVMRLNGEWNNITDLSEGSYVLKLEVTDKQGKMASDSLSFEVTLLDSDGDWGATCNAETWYDKEENVYCGPDIYDTDDDNDGSLDVRDAWPTDPCANMDTDGDGQPDNVQCPLGVTTWLTEDPDDDGDGIPDVSEGAGSGEDSEDSSPIGTIIFVIIFILAAAFMIMRRNGDVE
ncbi:MAG: hypothetical protein VXX17_03025 [Candidatus Thermoplasmatota archaeon]|nr:hypothetical protein [Candidatus Thermoplasmatota archaeon]